MEEADDIYTINFCFIDGRHIAYELPADIDVQSIAEMISEESQIPTDQIRFIYHGRHLENNETLRHYNIKNGHTIHVVNRPASEDTPQTQNTPQAQNTPQTQSAWTPVNLSGGGTMMFGQIPLSQQDGMIDNIFDSIVNTITPSIQHATQQSTTTTERPSSSEASLNAAAQILREAADLLVASNASSSTTTQETPQNNNTQQTPAVSNQNRNVSINTSILNNSSLGAPAAVIAIPTIVSLPVGSSLRNESMPNIQILNATQLASGVSTPWMSPQSHVTPHLPWRWILEMNHNIENVTGYRINPALRLQPSLGLYIGRYVTASNVICGHINTLSINNRIDSQDAESASRLLAYISASAAALSAEFCRIHSHLTGNVTQNNTNHTANTESEGVPTEGVRTVDTPQENTPTVQDTPQNTFENHIANHPISDHISNILNDAMSSNNDDDGPESSGTFSDDEPDSPRDIDMQSEDPIDPLENLPESIRRHYENWTQNPSQFSQSVIPFAREKPWSTAYRAGVPNATVKDRSTRIESAESALKLQWHRSLNSSNVSNQIQYPQNLSKAYLTEELENITQLAMKNSDYIEESEMRYPNIQKAIRLLNEAARQRHQD